MNESIEFKSKYTVDDNGYYGQFGGAYIPKNSKPNLSNCSKIMLEGQHHYILPSDWAKNMAHKFI